MWKNGNFLCIVGENGSGKSTLIKCILGLNTGYEGNIIKNGRVGYLPQKTEIQSNFPASVEEIILSGTILNNIRKVFYTKKDKEIAKDIMQKLKLYDIRKECFRELSRRTTTKSINCKNNVCNRWINDIRWTN